MTPNNKVIILGGGLLGVSTFYELVSRGVETILVEKESFVARGTSYANGGVLHPSLPDPWNNPGIGGHLFASLFNPNAPIKLHLSQVPKLINWGISFLQHSIPARHIATTKANFELAHYSTKKTIELCQRLGLEFEHADVGTLKIFRNEAERETALKLADLLAHQGLNFEVLDRDGLLAREPVLAQAVNGISGALLFPDDHIGNARLFCERLAETAIAKGGTIRLGETVQDLLIENGQVTGVRLGDEVLSGQVVICAGVNAPQFAGQAGIALPIQPAKGYSITLDINGVDGKPLQHAIIDPTLHIAVTPLGHKLRVLGMAEFIGMNTEIDQKRIALLRQFFDKLFPDISRNLDWHRAENWAGLRPMSADGRPFIGASGVTGLWLNCGHGHLGWTKAVGSAHLFADIFTGQEPDINAAYFALDARRRQSIFA